MNERFDKMEHDIVLRTQQASIHDNILVQETLNVTLMLQTYALMAYFLMGKYFSRFFSLSVFRESCKTTNENCKNKRNKQNTTISAVLGDYFLYSGKGVAISHAPNF